ncbi:MAG: nuclear transport factor 2 family protein [Cypionkella sp.]
MDRFRQRLAAAYDAWSASGGTTPAAFFELMDEGIDFQTVLERAFPCDRLSGPFIGKAAVLGYWAALAESWELVSTRTDALVAEGDRIVWIGRVRWPHRRTLRELASPKVDVWTVWQGRAIRYLEMFDSASYAWAIGYDGPPAAEARARA